MTATLKSRLWRAKNPEKTRAHIAVWTARRRGERIKRPCEICGSVKSDAHHDDYTKPLEVRWVCRNCHARIHHPNSVRRALPPIPRPPKKPQGLGPAEKLRTEGKSYQEIAEAVGATKGTVYKWLNKTNYKYTKRQRRRDTRE